MKHGGITVGTGHGHIQCKRFDSDLQKTSVVLCLQRAATVHLGRCRVHKSRNLVYGRQMGHRKDRRSVGRDEGQRMWNVSDMCLVKLNEVADWMQGPKSQARRPKRYTAYVTHAELLTVCSLPQCGSQDWHRRFKRVDIYRCKKNTTAGMDSSVQDPFYL